MLELTIEDGGHPTNVLNLLLSLFKSTDFDAISSNKPINSMFNVITVKIIAIVNFCFGYKTLKIYYTKYRYYKLQSMNFFKEKLTYCTLLR